MRRTVGALVTATALLGIGMTSYDDAAAEVASRTSFVTPDSAPTGGVLPQHSAVGDFDGDGNLDAVTVNEGPSSVFGPGIGVSLGDGAGQLGQTVTTDVGGNYGACDLAVGNWNGDAMDDLVVIGCVTSGPGNLVAFVSTGGGHLVQTQSWPGSNLQIAAGDFNNDGLDDFATSEKGSPTVSSYLGKGDGTFHSPTTVNPPFDSYDLEAADLNDDGNLDLIGADGGPVWSMLGKGDGTFEAQVFQFSDVVTGLELAVAKLDGDRYPDVAVVDASGGHVGVGLGNGDGTFRDGKQITIGALQVVWVAAGRVTRDGNADLVVGLDNDSNVSALLSGHGDGTFGKATHWVTGTAGLTLGDFDADGRKDLLAFDLVISRHYLSVSAGKGFRAARLYKGPLAQDLVDLNGDGVLDKISGTTGLIRGGLKSQIIVQLGKGDTTFGKQILSHIRNETASSGVGDIDVADINEDGVPDVVGGFENFQANVHNLFWMIGNGDGSFGKATLSDTGDFNADVNAIAAADLNGDGHADIIANTLADMSVRRGNGRGGFKAPLLSGVGSGANRAVLVADFTGDGVKDVVTTVRTGNEDFGSGDIRLQRGNGDGTLNLIQTRSVDSNLSSGTARDLDGDGRPDVVTAGSRGSNGGQNAMWVLLTSVGGSLGTPTPYGGPTGQVATGDLDGDGDPDVATSGLATIDFYLNDGSGGFPRIERVIAAGGLGTVGDLDGDGDPDVVSGSPYGEYAVHINGG